MIILVLAVLFFLSLLWLTFVAWRSFFRSFGKIDDSYGLSEEEPMERNKKMFSSPCAKFWIAFLLTLALLLSIWLVLLCCF